MDRHILIVHGWMHSAARYRKLKEDLEEKGACKVTLLELPGFGDTPSHRLAGLLKDYGSIVRKELEEHTYDCAIGHSMGGNALLRAVAGGAWEGRVILLSPEYLGITPLKPLVLLLPVIIGALWLLKIPCRFTAFLIKAMSLFTINRWEQIDDRIVEDARKASPLTGALSMWELAWDRWQIEPGQWSCQDTVLILGEKDRLISRRKMRVLRAHAGDCRVHIIKGIGHTAVAEAYDRLLNLLLA